MSNKAKALIVGFLLLGGCKRPIVMVTIPGSNGVKLTVPKECKTAPRLWGNAVELDDCPGKGQQLICLDANGKAYCQPLRAPSPKETK